MDPYQIFQEYLSFYPVWWNEGVILNGSDVEEDRDPYDNIHRDITDGEAA